MTPLLGKPLSEFIFVDQADPSAVAEAEEDLRQTEITQPAVLTSRHRDDASARRLWHSARHDHGTQPGRIWRSGCVRCAAVRRRVGSRERPRPRHDSGRGCRQGKMAAVFAPIAEVERILKTIDGYVVIANVNSNTQSVIGGASEASSRRRRFSSGRLQRRGVAGQPRLSHLHRRGGDTRAPTHPGVFFAEDILPALRPAHHRRDCGVTWRQQANAAPRDERRNRNQSGSGGAFG